MKRHDGGFTLLEVLVALAIVAMSVGALLGTVTSSASNVIYLKDKTLSEWVALNRLTEDRIDTNLPDKGKRTGESVMGGTRYVWEEEVVELPIVKGMFRIEVRAHSTGELVDDSRPVDKPKKQALSKSSPSGSSLDKTAWTSTVTGVVSSSRSARNNAGPSLLGNLQGSPNTPPNTPPAPNPPKPTPP
jgi:general secretion pathway protein I